MKHVPENKNKKKQQQQHTAIEDVQRQFTKEIVGLQDLSYEQRLETIKLPSLE